PDLRRRGQCCARAARHVCAGTAGDIAMRAGQRAVSSAKTIAAELARQRELADAAERRRELWHRLNGYVTERGGAITTLPYSWPARLETPKESALPVKLRELGWIVIDKGQETRLGPHGNCYGFSVRDVFDVALPR